ncbi:hypothetical protein V5O48_006704 [Marasmius crinis-equi]|uniref:Uncharacterized protein n=1 Tax=Marasmius crinis-equi TaxID=585013 RepID=A0ABR3FIT2_9AGAR
MTNTAQPGSYLFWRLQYPEIVVERMKQYRTQRAASSGGPYVSIGGHDGRAHIHRRLAAVLQGKLPFEEPVPLNATGFSRQVVDSVLEVAYNLDDPCVSIHSAFASDWAVAEKISMISLAKSWQFVDVETILSNGAKIEGVINGTTRAQVLSLAMENDLVVLQSVLQEGEELGLM